MGAMDFTQTAKGKTASEAFDNACEAAAFDHGHAGYTGTIAEKHSFRKVTPNEGETPKECMARMFEAGDTFIEDKWGPAACIAIAQGEFLFFGYASS